MTLSEDPLFASFTPTRAREQLRASRNAVGAPPTPLATRSAYCPLLSYPLVLLALSAAACAHRPAPAAPSERALFRDLERQVTVKATTGWEIDRIALDEMLATALQSSCRVDPLARRALSAWLDAEVARLGGPVDAAWRARGKQLAKVDDLLVVTRIRLLLERAEASAGDCPFWLEPQRPFRSRQTSEQRWQLSFGGGGKGIATARGDDLDLSAGGAGRLLFGRAFTNGHSLYAGLELGGSAAFPKDDAGARSTVVFALDVVAPLVYRRTFTNSYVELESGWLGRAVEGGGALDHGLHLGIAVGARALRTRFVFPGVAVGVSYERLFARDDPDLAIVKIGARVALDLDL